jgi:YNFM family putative membrane transporter
MLAARLVGRLVARLGEGGMVRMGGILMAVAYVLAALQPTLVYFPLAMLLSGAGFAIAHSTLQTRAPELAPAQRGTAIALFAFALLLGGGLGTFVAGDRARRVHVDPARDGGSAGDLYRHRGAVAPNQTTPSA